MPDQPAVSPHEPEQTRELVLLSLGSPPNPAVIEAFCRKNNIVILKADSISEVFSRVESSPANLPVAFIWYLHSSDDPGRCIHIFRSAGISLPVFLCCRSALEASFYNQQQQQMASSAVYAWADKDPLPVAVQGLLSSWVAQRARTQRPCPSEGELDDMGLARLLGELLRRRANGQLHLKRTHSWRTLTIRDGEVVFADSSLLDENLGRFLLSQGIISRIEYRWSQRLQLREGIRQGEALVKIGVLNQQALNGLLRKQIMQKLINCFGGGLHTFSWDEATRADEPGSVYHFNIFNILYKSLWRHLSQEGVAKQWAEVSTKSLIFLPIDPRLRALLVAQWPALKDHPCALPLQEIPAFGSMSDRERLACVNALTLLEVAVLADNLPLGMGFKSTQAPQKLQNLAELQALIALHVSESATNLCDMLRQPPSTDPAALSAAVESLLKTFSPDAFEGTEEVQGPLKSLRARLRFLLANQPSSKPLTDARARRRSRALDAENAYQAGLDHLADERFTEALQAFQLAQTLNDEEPLYMLYEGWTCVSMASPGDPAWNRGKLLLEEAQIANPLMIEAYALRARVALAEGQRDDARELLRHGLRFSPDHRQAKAMLDAIEQGDLPDDIQQDWPDLVG